jgi:hypothetical protein
MEKPAIVERSGKGWCFVLVAMTVVAAFLYGYYLDKYKGYLAYFLSKKNPRYEVTFSSISSGGLLFISNEINDLQIRILDRDKEYILQTKKVKIKNLIFTKIFDILLDEKVELRDYTNELHTLNLSKSSNVSVELDSSYKIKSVEVFLPEISFADEEEKIVVKNLALGFLKITTYDDMRNSVLKVSSDSVVFSFKDDKGKDKNYETNFELVASSLGELGSGDKLVNQDVEVEKFVFNDISNNFAFNVDGGLKSNFLMSTANLTLNLKLINYNSMVRAINDGKKYFLLDKEYLSMFIEVLTMIPANPQNTVSNKFYTLKYNTATKSFTVNNVNGESLVKSLLLRKTK